LGTVDELRHEIAERAVDFEETAEGQSAHPAQQPLLDDQDGLLDFRFSRGFLGLAGRMAVL
jgi:hypothetical protein